MIIPIHSDRALKHTPWVNYALIALNVIIFITTRQAVAQTQFYYLNPGDMHLYQFITYQFLHADTMHLLGNMIFLFVFGNSVEDRLGKIGYIFFYLGAGVCAGIGHTWVEMAPVLGASGSIAAVTGAYLALFPMTNITLVYWWFFIGSFEVSGMLLILFRVGQDALFQMLGIGNVAYLAHLAGYAFGFAAGMGLLVGRVISREPYDMLALIEQRRRRGQFRRITRGGYQPWESAARGGGPVNSAAHKDDDAVDVTPETKQLMDMRAAISADISGQNLSAAAKGYRELLALDPKQVMGQQQQLDLANYLMADGRYDTAATAYELFLATYATYSEKHHVQLIVGLIYARYLDQNERAKQILDQAVDRLEGEDKKLADQIIAQIAADA